MSEGTEGFATGASASANVGDIFSMPISDSIRLDGPENESEALSPPVNGDDWSSNAASDAPEDSTEAADDAGDKPSDSGQVNDNDTTSEVPKIQSAESDSKIVSDASIQEATQVAGVAEPNEAESEVPAADSKAEFTEATAEMAAEAAVQQTDTTNVGNDKAVELVSAQQDSENTKLFREDDNLFTTGDTDEANILPKPTTQASSNSVRSPGEEPAIPPVQGPTTEASPSYQSGIPVDKLTTSSDIPQARLSPMRSFSRIPSIPEQPRPISVTSTYSSQDDSFASSDSLETEQPLDMAANYQDLPPELISMADRFTESIHQITSTASLSVEKLSELFQDFYVTIQDKATAYLRRNTLRRTYEVQMMSFEEIAKKKKERKQKEAQKLLYEDLVEKMVCEACYNEIFMFQGSDDEAKDATLATKIAALKLINIGMEHLGVPELKDSGIGPFLIPAGNELYKMVDKHCPKEKLALLISAHKQIVDVLSKLTQTNGQDGQSGADFVLPTLIFSVIQADPPHIASNLAFIQRFRTSKTINGETAYCLTNFEAVVAFLETVDLATLKVDPAEIQALAAARPISTSSIANPLTLSPQSSIKSVSSASTTKSSGGTSSAAAAAPLSPVLPVRDAKRAANPPARSSSLQASSASISQPINNGMSMPQQGIDSSSKRLSFYPSDIAASAVNTADHGIKSLGSTFENSYKFLFGGRGSSPSTNVMQKPVQMKATANAASLEKRTQEVLQSSSALISTYTDVSKRESTTASPPAYAELLPSERSTPTTDLPSTGFSTFRQRAASSLFSDEVATSQPSGSSFPGTIARVGSSDSNKATKSATDEDGGKRSIFSNMRSFGRGGPAKESAIDSEALNNLPKIAKPSQKFDGIESASQLRLGDIDELLKDYKRMIDYLKSISAFEESS
ncbi:hypothetical protein V1517DRAFT_314345 [Lipomyces orientalis]|uniref:Uncharacterized protein n=1 Tax=Lipomyces orientalis TaxID=1233043 RepID=A0ACC3TZ68_9ASCO